MSGIEEKWLSFPVLDVSDPEMDQIIDATRTAKEAARDDRMRRVDLPVSHGLLDRLFAARQERDRLLYARRDLDKLFAALDVEDVEQALSRISSWEPVQ